MITTEIKKWKLSSIEIKEKAKLTSFLDLLTISELITEASDAIKSKQEEALVMNRINESNEGQVWREMGCVVPLPCPGDMQLIY